MVNLKEVLKKQISIISPSESELKVINGNLKSILAFIGANIKKNNINASIFVGGSFAKNTLIKKKKYDIDLFVRFDKRYEESKLASLLSRIVPKNAIKLHGSRDYYVLKMDNIDFEIIPTIKINKPSEARNVTDLSYFHVNYVSNSIKKNKKLAEEIRIAKHFIHSSDCYGAESYINGFSGYGVELIVIYYKSFMTFVKAMTKIKLGKEKLVLDPAKYYKNKQSILQEVNEAKLNSPIVLIDPTFKERNALAALSRETFAKFQDVCRRFLKNPSEKFFEIVDREQAIKKKYGKNVIELELLTNRQAGDIAGTKLKKFYGFFINEVKRYFDVGASEFIYDDTNNKGKILLVVKQKKEIIFSGPPVEMKERLVEFKKEHKHIKIVKGKAQASEKSISFDNFMNRFENVKGKIIDEMGVSEIKRL